MGVENLLAEQFVHIVAVQDGAVNRLPELSRTRTGLPAASGERRRVHAGTGDVAQLLRCQGYGDLGNRCGRRDGLRNILLHGGLLVFNVQLLRRSGAYALIAAGMLEECNCQLLQCDSPHGHGNTLSKFFTGTASLAYEAEPKRLQNGLMLVDAAKLMCGVVDV